MTSVQDRSDNRVGDRRWTRCRSSRGASLVEYALLVALIGVACITAVGFLGGSNDGSLSKSASSIVNAN